MVLAQDKKKELNISMFRRQRQKFIIHKDISNIQRDFQFRENPKNLVVILLRQEAVFKYMFSQYK